MPEDKVTGTLLKLSEEEIRKITTRSASFATFYCNHTRVAPSFFDVRIFCGQSSIKPTGEQTVEEEFCLVFSPECAKAFAENLLTGMRGYEEFFGKVRIAPALPVPDGKKTPKQ